MAGVTRITLSGVAPIRAQLQTAEQLFRSPGPLLKVFGVVLLQNVQQTFREGGRPQWKALASSTLAARREGGGGAKPLLNTGALQRSFDVRTTEREAILYSNSPIARFQNDGTRGPYEIRPKNGKALALPFLPGRDSGGGTAGTGKAGRFSLKGLGRASRNATGAFVAAKGPRAGKTVSPHTNVAFYAHVTHPGLTPRPILPTPEQILPELERAGATFLATQLAKRGR